MGDWLFRRVRYFNQNIEIWTITVIIVEMFAQHYYAALARAARCPLLADICKDILADESHHIRFQSERLQTIVKDRSPWLRRMSIPLYRSLFYVVTLCVWLTPGYVFRRSGQSFGGYWRRATRRFSQMLSELYADREAVPKRKVSMRSERGSHWQPQV